MSAAGWVEILVRASLEGGLLILGVWAVCRLWPGIPAWARSGLWWLACARLLLGLMPLAQIAVRAPLPVTAVGWPSAVASTLPDAFVPPSAHWTEGEAAVTADAAAARPASGGLPAGTLPIALVLLWAAGAGVRASGLALQFRRVRRLFRDAVPAPGPLSVGPARRPSVRLLVSRDAPVPMVCGLFHPAVLLPVVMLDRPRQDVELAVAHEISHVRRGDLWLAWVPAAAETVFWFHPLVPLAVREFVQACEEACDLEALEATGAAPFEYGRLLLAFGVHRRVAAVSAMPCGSPNPRQLVRRLSMLKHIAPLPPGLRNAAIGVLCAFSLVGLAPLRVVPTLADPGPPTPAPSESPFLAPSIEPGAGGVAEPEAPRAARSEEAGVAAEKSNEDAEDNDGYDYDVEYQPPIPPIPAIAPMPGIPATPGTPATPAMPAMPPTPAAYRPMWSPAPAPRASLTPHVPRAPRAARAPRSGVSWGYDDSRREGYAYVLVHHDEGHTSGSGNIADWNEVRSLKQSLDHDFLWVRTGDRRYVIEDPALLEQVEEAFMPQQEIGRRQGDLGQIQSRIGKAQSQIGQEQARIGRQQAEIGVRQAEIAQRMAYGPPRGERAKDLESVVEDLASQMEMLGHQQERLGARMEPLAREAAELGVQMEALATQLQTASRQAHRKVRTLIDGAIRSGKARILP